MKRKLFCLLLIAVTIFILLLFFLNPNRASFNNAVFEGNPNAITENQKIMKNIHDINLKDYNNDEHPFIKRNNYFVFSIYDVDAGNAKYHILGILGRFKLFGSY